METINAKSKQLKAVSEALKDALNGQPVTLKNAGHLHGLAAGLKQGEVVIRGNAGDYVGVLNDGATIKVTKNAGKYIADNMTGGEIIVEGSTDYGAGQYCYGGTVVVHGDAGDFTATMNKGATVIVGGNVGNEVATYMLAGEVIVVGNAGTNLANYLIRGQIYIGGEWESLGHNVRVDEMMDDDVAKLQALFDTYEINADLTGFKKIVAASERPFYH